MSAGAELTRDERQVVAVGAPIVGLLAERFGLAEAITVSAGLYTAFAILAL